MDDPKSTTRPVQTLTMVLLAPRRFVEFLFREYLSPLSQSERMFLLAAVLMSLVSATGVYGRLTVAYGPHVGFGGAAGLELLYIGAALAGARARGWTKVGIVGMSVVAIIVAIVLNLAQQQAVGNHEWYGWVEAVSFPALAMISSLVAHGISAARHTDEEHLAAQKRLATEREAEQRRSWELEQEGRDRDLLRWSESQRVQAEAEAAKIRARAEARASAQVSAGVSAGAASASVQARQDADIEAVRALVADIRRTEPDVSVAELARRCRVNRQFLYRHGIVEPKGYQQANAAD
jgi:hypothetical protein